MISDYIQLSSSIFFSSQLKDTSFIQAVEVDFQKVAANPIGARLIQKINTLSWPILLCPGSADCANFSKIQDKKWVEITLSLKESSCFSSQGEIISLPTHVILFHELTHGYHYLSGKNATTHLVDRLLWHSDEEYKTIVGFPSKNPDKKTPKITENAFRKAEGLPVRYSHKCPNSAQGMPALIQARTKVWGLAYERFYQQYPENLGPPPVNVITPEDFGSEQKGALLVWSHDKNGNERDWIILVDAIIEHLQDDTYRYIWDDSMPSESPIDIIKRLAPKLIDQIVSIKIVVAIRISGSEISMFRQKSA